MALPFSKISSFMYSFNEAYTEYSLNQRFAKLLANDKYIANHFESAPGVWECFWYNDNTVNGYYAGDICWLNTSDVLTFIEANSDIIQQYANKNHQIASKLFDFKSGDDYSFESYYNVLTGYTDESGIVLSALFEIGQLSEPIQLFVSLKDNNKDPIYNSNSWKKFFVDDPNEVDKILDDVISVRFDALFNSHLKKYHLNDKSISVFNELNLLDDCYLSDNLSNCIYLSNLVNLNCNNISAGFQYFDRKAEEMHGFDYVKYFVKHPYDYNEISAITENQWFRLWNSGYLEHGGIININNAAQIADDKVIVKLDWKITTESIKAYSKGELAKSTSSVISVDESEQLFGDNLVNLIIEIDELSVNNSLYAPKFKGDNYIINLTPIIPKKTIDDHDLYNQPNNVEDYENCVGNQIDIFNVKNNQFSIIYNRHSTANYYSYYAAGYI